MMWIPREIEPLLLARAAQRPVVVLTGARQTGKTSLVRRLFPDREFVSLDLPSEAEQAERDPRGFLGRHPPPLVIDEVQYAPGLFRHLKVEVDRRRDHAGRFILTGSQKFTLAKSVSDSLAGRAEILELEGLSWSEIRAAKLNVTPEEAVVRGGFPELYANLSLDAHGFYRSYVATYLERDLWQLLEVSNLRDYERFLRACALRSAQILNRAELARDVGISGSTAGAWLSILETSNQVVLLEPWFSNRTKTLMKSPKLHLCDSGLLSFLVQIRTVSDLSGSPLRGPMWESFVFSELRRHLCHRRGGWELNFWRDRSREADFLVHRGGRFVLADAKWTEHPDGRDAAPLRRVAAELPAGRLLRQAIICRSTNRFPLAEGVEAIPIGDVDRVLTEA